MCVCVEPDYIKMKRFHINICAHELRINSADHPSEKYCAVYAKMLKYPHMAAATVCFALFEGFIMCGRKFVNIYAARVHIESDYAHS